MADDEGCSKARVRTEDEGTDDGASERDEDARTVITPSAQALGQLIGDLRVAVQSIFDALEDLQRGRARLDPSRLSEGLASIERAAWEMNHCIDDMTDKELIRTGSLVLRRSSARLDELIEQALEQLPSSAAQKRLQFFFFGSDERAAVSCDEERIFRLIVTLLGNAVGFTPVGGEIVIRCWSSASEVGMEIRDSGPSLAERHLRCLSGRQRGGRRSPSLGTSPGLGLHIARAVAAAHGGRLWVDSNTGRGATFALALPRGLAH